MRSHRQRIDAAVVRQSARGHWLEILGRLAPELEAALARPGRHVPCPVHGGKDGFRLFADADETGGGICNTCGSFPDGFDLLMWLTGGTFPEILEEVAQVQGLRTEQTWSAPPRRRATPPPRTGRRNGKDNRSLASSIDRVWAGCIAPSDERAAPLRRYMLRRGLDWSLLDANVVRFHPDLPYWEEDACWGRTPAMVAKVSGEFCDRITVHRTYLTLDGCRAPVPSPKKLMSYPDNRVLAGGAIRLCAPDSELGIAEGLETALAVRKRTGMPVWAAVSATLLERFEPPEVTSLVVVWADKDRSGRGEEAAIVLRDRLVRMGIQVSIHVPPGAIPDGAKGLDWADVWGYRLAAVA
jgi:putative DNA primase/helicase